MSAKVNAPKISKQNGWPAPPQTARGHSAVTLAASSLGGASRWGRPTPCRLNGGPGTAAVLLGAAAPNRCGIRGVTTPSVWPVRPGWQASLWNAKGFRQAARGAALLDQRGRPPRLGPLFSAMESCKCFKPWHDKKSGRTGRKLTGGRCRHYYSTFTSWMSRRAGVPCGGPLGGPSGGKSTSTNTSGWLIRCALTALPWHWPPTLSWRAQPGPRCQPWAIASHSKRWRHAGTPGGKVLPGRQTIARRLPLAPPAGRVGAGRGVPARRRPEAAAQSAVHPRGEGPRSQPQLNRQALKLDDQAGRGLRIAGGRNDGRC